MYTDFEMHDAYQPRLMDPLEWEVWSRYSYHHTTAAPISQFLAYLQERKKRSGANGLPTQDILFESMLDGTASPSAVILQEVNDHRLMIDYVCVYLDFVETSEQRLLEIANVILLARRYSIEMRDLGVFPPFSSIILTNTVGTDVLNAASTLKGLYKVIEPSAHGEKHRFELQC